MHNYPYFQVSSVTYFVLLCSNITTTPLLIKGVTIFSRLEEKAGNREMKRRTDFDPGFTPQLKETRSQAASGAKCCIHHGLWSSEWSKGLADEFDTPLYLFFSPSAVDVFARLAQRQIELSGNERVMWNGDGGHDDIASCAHCEYVTCGALQILLASFSLSK